MPAPDEWEKTFGDPRLCAAIAERITFRGTLIQTRTEFYRYQNATAQQVGRPLG
ncbi:hypothetical protein ACFU7Y_26060 [Kitasatospora sp. NPDC057542]|uniref:hypothetical protein n=1 Tax=Streptomycetaceae TaxID=2062 RepID=UPI0035A82B57